MKTDSMGFRCKYNKKQYSHFSGAPSGYFDWFFYQNDS